MKKRLVKVEDNSSDDDLVATKLKKPKLKEQNTNRKLATKENYQNNLSENKPNAPVNKQKKPEEAKLTTKDQIIKKKLIKDNKGPEDVVPVVHQKKVKSKQQPDDVALVIDQKKVKSKKVSVISSEEQNEKITSNNTIKHHLVMPTDILDPKGYASIDEPVNEALKGRMIVPFDDDNEKPNEKITDNNTRKLKAIPTAILNPNGQASIDESVNEAQKWKMRFLELEKQFNSIIPLAIDESTERFESYQKSTESRIKSDSLLLDTIKNELLKEQKEFSRISDINKNLNENVKILQGNCDEFIKMEHEFSKLKIEHSLQSGKIKQLYNEIEKVNVEKTNLDLILFEYDQKGTFLNLIKANKKVYNIDTQTDEMLPEKNVLDKLENLNSIIAVYEKMTLIKMEKLDAKKELYNCIQKGPSKGKNNSLIFVEVKFKLECPTDGDYTYTYESRSPDNDILTFAAIDNEYEFAPEVYGLWLKDMIEYIFDQ
jgi:hypothetical protein